MKSLSFLALFVALLCECQSPSNDKNNVGQTTADDFPKALNDGLMAHGGLSRWRNFSGLSFEITSKPVRERHLIDLNTRQVLITTDSSFQIGFDGKDVWVSPNLKAYPGNSARFYHNLVFYFFALPFVMADPGTHHAALPDVHFNGHDYNRVKVTFGAQVGDSPEDQYVLWFDKDSQKLAMINYSVTYFNSENADKYNAIVYEEWQEADQLKVPRRWSYYKWENDTLGDLRGSMLIENVHFSTEKLESELFRRPPVSEIDTIQ